MCRWGGVVRAEAAKSAAARYWKTILSKHDDLSKRFIEAYPDLSDETTDELPRGETKETFTAARFFIKDEEIEK